MVRIIIVRSWLSVLLVVYLIITIYMYFSRDANFTIYYNFISLIVFLLLLITTIIAIFKCLKLRYFLVLIIIIATHIFLKKYIFMGNLEKFLYIKNCELYIKSATMIVQNKLDGYVDLEGPYMKLSRDFTQVVNNDEDYIEIHYGIFSTFSFPGKIIYTTDMKKTLKKEKDYCVKYEILNENWGIFYH